MKRIKIRLNIGPYFIEYKGPSGMEIPIRIDTAKIIFWEGVNEWASEKNEEPNLIEKRRSPAGNSMREMNHFQE